MVNRERLSKEFCELVSIDAPTLGEREIADLLKVKLEELGFQVQEDNAGELIGGNCGNLFATLEGEIVGLPLLFSSHMDTVEPALNKRPIVHPDGRITSSGDTVLGADDVAGIVAILEAVRSLKEDGLPHRSLEVFFPVAEEIFSKGCAVFDRDLIKAKEAYILDLNGRIGRAAFRAPSIVTFEIHMEGLSSHAGFSPETGIHAILSMAKGIAKMEMGRTKDAMTVNIGKIQGGKAVNIVPCDCFVQGEVRGFNHEKVMDKIEEIREIFAKEAQDSGATLNFNVTVNCKAYEMNTNDMPAKRYLSACEQVGAKAEFVETYGGSDFNILAEKGMIGLVLSNAMNDVHSCKEYTSVADLVLSTQIVTKIMQDNR